MTMSSQVQIPSGYKQHLRQFKESKMCWNLSVSIALIERIALNLCCFISTLIWKRKCYSSSSCQSAHILERMRRDSEINFLSQFLIKCIRLDFYGSTFLSAFIGKLFCQLFIRISVYIFRWLKISQWFCFVNLFHHFLSQFILNIAINLMTYTHNSSHTNVWSFL